MESNSQTEEHNTEESYDFDNYVMKNQPAPELVKVIPCNNNKQEDEKSPQQFITINTYDANNNLKTEVPDHNSDSSQSYHFSSDKASQNNNQGKREKNIKPSKKKESQINSGLLGVPKTRVRKFSRLSNK